MIRSRGSHHDSRRVSSQPIQPGHGRALLHVAATSWQQRVATARDPHEVVEIARDFVATFSPYELHSLPEACRPSTKLFADDIPQLAFDLVRHECTRTGIGEFVHALACFFSQASARLAQLAAYEERVR